MRVVIWAVLAASLTAGCTQLPARRDIGVDVQPTMQGTYVAGNPEILGNNLASYVGAVCVPASDGVCREGGFAPGTYLATGQTPVVTPAAPNSSPSYRSLITSSFGLTANFPFVKPAGSQERLNEVEVRTVATATTPGNSFPGAEALRQRLQADGVRAPRVYWVRSASIVAVNTRSFDRVSSSANVVGSGFGLDGRTYNSNEAAQQQVIMGLDLRVVDLAPAQGSGLAPAAPRAVPPPAPPQAIAVGSEGEALVNLSPPGRGSQPRAGAR